MAKKHLLLIIGVLVTAICITFLVSYSAFVSSPSEEVSGKVYPDTTPPTIDGPYVGQCHDRKLVNDMTFGSNVEMNWSHFDNSGGLGIDINSVLVWCIDKTGFSTPLTPYSVTSSGGSFTFPALSLSLEGWYTLRIKVCDIATNCTEATATVYVTKSDTCKPKILYNGLYCYSSCPAIPYAPVNNMTFSQNADVSMFWWHSDYSGGLCLDSGIDIATVSVGYKPGKPDEGGSYTYLIPTVTPSAGSFAFPINSSNLVNGDYTIRIVVYDKSTKPSPNYTQVKALVHVQRSGTPPTTPTITFSKNPVLPGEEFTFTAHSTDPDGDSIVKYWWRWQYPGETEPGAPWSSVVPTQGPISVSEPGNHIVYCKAEDEHGALSERGSATLTVVCENHPPTAYYVKNGGDDSKPGTSDSEAWATLSRVNSATLNPGDIVYLKKGSTFTGTLEVKDSGMENTLITIQSYGEASNPPIIDGENSHRYGIKVIGSYVKVDGIKLTKHTSSADTCNEDQWSASVLVQGSGRLYYYYEDACWQNEALVVPIHDIILSNLSIMDNDPTADNIAGIYVIDANHVTVDHCVITNTVRSGSGGVRLDNVDDSIVRYCTIYNCKGAGIDTTGFDLWYWHPINPADGRTYYVFLPSRNNIIEYNRCSYTWSGIQVCGFDNIAQYNICYENCWNPVDAPTGCNGFGIEVYTGPGSIIRYNVCYNNRQCNDAFNEGWEGPGIYLDSGSSESKCYGNICFGNEGPGIIVRQCANTEVFNNVLYNNSTKNGTYLEGGGIRLNDGLPDRNHPGQYLSMGEIFNNIILDDNRAEVIITTPSVTNATFHDNVYYNNSVPSGNGRFMWGDGNPINFSDWQSLSGDSTSRDTNPFLRDALNHQFQLTEDSPCINMGYDPSNETWFSQGYDLLLAPDTLDISEFLNLVTLNQNLYHGWEIGVYVYSSSPTDADGDGVDDASDNCSNTANGPLAGTCYNYSTKASWGSCISDDECRDGSEQWYRWCDTFQNDDDGDGRGDVCDNN